MFADDFSSRWMHIYYIMDLLRFPLSEYGNPQGQQKDDARGIVLMCLRIYVFFFHQFPNLYLIQNHRNQ